MWCLIWCLNETWKPTSWRSCKVIWKRGGERSRDKASREHNYETWRRRTTATLLSVSFGIYRRRRWDVLMGRHGYVPLRVLVTYHWDVVGCFIWDVFETSWRRTDGTSSLHPLETSSQHTNKTSWRRTTETSWRRSTETSLRVSFGTYLQRRWDVQKDVVTTSPRRLFAGWAINFTRLPSYLLAEYTLA